MKFTKTQTQLIVYELIFIFLGVAALLRNPKLQPQVSIPVSESNISTVTVSSVYSMQNKRYSPAKPAEEKIQEKSVTIAFDPEDSVYKKKKSSKTKKSKRTYKRKPAVRKVEYE